MRNFNVYPNNQSASCFMNTTTEGNLSSLASKFMDMFDISKMEPSLLQKRQALENLHQKELQKKIKTTMATGEYRHMMASSPAPVLFHQDFIPNPSFNNYGNLLEQMKRQNEMQQRQNEMQQRQNMMLPLAFRQQEQSLQFYPSYLNKNLMGFDKLSPKVVNERLRQNVDGVCVKEEYVKQEEVPKSHGKLILGNFKPFANDCRSENNTTNDSLSERSVDKSELQMPECNDEPVLAELTKAFPDWDLATIFSFVKSGKAKDTFEKEKKTRVERKLNKGKSETTKEKAEKKQKVVKAARSVKKAKEDQLTNKIESQLIIELHKSEFTQEQQ